MNQDVSRLLAAVLCLLLITGCGVQAAPSSTGTRPMTQAVATAGVGTEYEASAHPVTSRRTAAPTMPAPSIWETVVPAFRTVRLIGRTSVFDGEDGVYLSWSCSGFAFTFEGTAARLTVGTEGPWADQAGREALVGVFVDGETDHSATFTVGEADRTVTLAKGLAPGTHTIRVLKLSETSRSAAVHIGALQVQGSGVRPADAPRRRIEFVGDSITAGYGILAAKRKAPYRPTEQDGTLAYAFRAAQQLDAEATIIAVSGDGCYCDADGGRHELMPELYGYRDYLLERDLKKPSRTVWSNKGRTDAPQVVVVNLGTNDQYTVLLQKKEAAFTAAYTTFLKQLRANNPAARLLVTLGPMKYDLWPAIEEAVAHYREETGDERIYTYRYTYRYNEIEGGVTAGHPSAAVHARMAADLAAEIRRVTGW